MKRIVNRVLSIILAMAVLFCAVPLTGLVGLELFGLKASAVEETETTISGTIGTKLSWSIDKTSRVLTIDNDGAMVSFASDDAPWRNYKAYFNAVVINEGCTNISQNAFYECDNIVSVDLPDTVETIGDSAFYGCTSIKQITIPQNVSELGFAVFYNCLSLEDVDFSNNQTITFIPQNAFAYCSNISKIDIPKSVTEIYDYAFSNCTKLSEINDLESVTYIGSYAFDYCQKLETIKLTNCTVYYNAFQNSGIVSVDIDNCLFKCERSYYNDRYAYTFKNCSNLKTVKVNNTDIPYDTFNNCKNIETIEIKGDCEIYYSAFNYLDFLTSVSFECTNLNIGSSAFYDCDALTSISINCSASDEFNYIGSQAFYGCDNLESAIISVGVIDSEAFANCPKLEKVTIYNKNCSIAETAISIYSTIYGFTGSTAETFANTYGYNFVSIDTPCEHTYSNDCDISCNVCGETRETDAHSYNAWSVIKEASCDETGLKERTCSICGDVDKEIIAMLPHTDEDEDGICEVCKKQFEVKYPMHGVCGENLTWNLDDEGVLTIEGTGAMYDFNSGSEYIAIPSASSNNLELDYSYETTANNQSQDGYIKIFRWNLHFDAIKKVIIGDGVTTIGAGAFAKCRNLSEVSISDSVGDFGTFAFMECTSLETITIPEKVTSLRSKVFAECSNLTEVTFNAEFCNVNTNAFNQCPIKTLNVGANVSYVPKISTIETVVFEEGATIVPAKAFRDCKELKSVSLPDTITSIEAYAFERCTSLESIKIPCNVVSIGEDAFSWCSSLSLVIFNAYNAKEHYSGAFYDTAVKTLNIGPGVNEIPDFRSVEIVTFMEGSESVPDFAFSNCSALTVVNLPDSLRRIGGDAFAKCTSLSEINIPVGVEYIGGEAFYGCAKLSSVTISENVSQIGYAAFKNCKSLESVEFNAIDCDTKNSDIFYGCENIKLVKIGSNVTKIPDYFMNGKSKLVSVEIPCSVKTIGVSAFAGTSLSEIVLPDGVEVIGQSAFANINGIKSLEIPESVIAISRCAFANLILLEEIKFNAINANEDCYYYGDIFANSGAQGEGITVIFGKNVEQVPAYIFEVGSETAIPNIKNVIIGSKVKTIGDFAFYHCSTIENVKIGESVESIGARAFKGCFNIKALEFPSSVKTIGEFAFSDCYGIETLKLSKVENISSYAFYKCNGLSGIDIPESVKTIGKNSFGSCLSLAMINYDATDCSFEDVGGDVSAFKNCKNVEIINIGDKVEAIPDFAFSGCENLEKVYIPDIVIQIAPLAFFNCGNVAIVCENGSYANVYAVQNGIRYLLKDNATGTAFEIKNGVLLGYDGTAQNIVLPSDVNSIGIEAFKGNITVTSIEIPYNISKIYSNAFANCPNLERVIIPFTVTNISASAFLETDATIYCYYNSYAYNYAVANNISYELITVTLSADSVSVVENEVADVNAVASIPIASGVPLVWKSGNTSVATVDSAGKIVGKNAGKTTVGVYALNGNLLDECTVTVAEKIKIDFEDVSTDTLKYGDKIVLHINTADLPVDTTIKWETSNDSVFKISNENDGCATHEKCATCTVESVGKGAAEIKATVVDESGTPISQNGEEITVSYNMSSKVNFWYKIIAFFKRLFGLNKTISQNY